MQTLPAAQESLKIAFRRMFGKIVDPSKNKIQNRLKMEASILCCVLSDGLAQL
jgi:hypothetical protein